MPIFIQETHQRNLARRLYFYCQTVSGVAIPSLLTPDSEISKDGGSFGDCTNEVVAITPTGSNNGLHYLDLTATETNADVINVIVKGTDLQYDPVKITSKANLELSTVNISMAATGKAVINILNSATGSLARAINIAATGGDVIRMDIGGNNNGVRLDGGLRGSNAIMAVSWLGAGLMSQGNGIGISCSSNSEGFRINTNTYGLSLNDNTNEIYIKHLNLTNPSVLLTCPTGSSVPVIQILQPSTGKVDAIYVAQSATGGGNAVTFSAANLNSYALNLDHLNPTGFCVRFDGILPEPTTPINKDNMTLTDFLGYMQAAFMNKRELDKNSLTDTLYRKDGTTILTSRSVTDDGSKQIMAETDSYTS